MRRYAVLDVFTDTPLEGNPLAVVLDAEGLGDDRMQAIAREFNLSETVFVLPSTDSRHRAKLRIFTPARELPFAGHPTIGTAILIASLRAPEMAGRDLDIVIEEEVGPVRCTVRLARTGAARASFVVPKRPERLGDPADAARIAAALSLNADEIGFDAHGSTVWSAGTPFCFVPVGSLAAIARAKPAATLGGVIGEGRGAFLYTRETAQPENTIHARMFGTKVGIMEDPATGAAAAAFAGVAAHFEKPEDGSHAILIEQGFEMGRPSLITLGMEIDGGRLVLATIGGNAVRVCEGAIEA